MTKEVDFDRTGMDRNIAARLLETVPLIYGKKGVFGVKLYQYFSWVDDVVDENELLTVKDKVAFVERQTAILQGTIPDDLSQEESGLLALPWNLIPQKEIKEQACVLLEAIKDDAKHMFLIPRSEAELREYHWKTLLPILQICSLCLNGRKFEFDDRFKNLIVHWERKDHVNHFHEDTLFGIIKLPLSPEEEAELTSRLEEDRQAWLEEKFTSTRLAEIQWDNLREMRANLPSIGTTNLTFAQKMFFAGYLLFRIQTNTWKNRRREKREE